MRKKIDKFVFNLLVIGRTLTSLFFVQVKETRKALKDSESGLEKMAIGHHIHDRAHVIKKSKNRKTGDEEINQEFINLDESMSFLCSFLLLHTDTNFEVLVLVLDIAKGAVLRKVLSLQISSYT